MENNNHKILETIEQLSSEIDFNQKNLSIILAAGHGKRIKSETSKMLHKIWGVSSVVRVSNSAINGLKSQNQIIVIGIKGEQVAKSIGKKENIKFVWQKEQKGTGHALRVALENLDSKFQGNIYVFSGDMGLVTSSFIENLKEKFEQSNSDLLFITAIFPQGDYGRVLRVPKNDILGNPSEKDENKIIEIMEYKDILSLKKNYEVIFNQRNYSFSQEELLKIREFNGGIYAFKSDKLIKHIKEIKNDNIQQEYYLPSLIPIFNSHHFSINSLQIEDYKEVLGFNTKDVLKKMEIIACQKVYYQLKNIITFEDENDFFIDDEVVKDILELEKSINNLDIVIGKGVKIYQGVKLNKEVQIGKNSILEGNIQLEKNVKIGENVTLSTYPNQKMIISENVSILKGDIIKGCVFIDKNCNIESSVIITGSNEYPVKIGKNVDIKGTTYIFGSVIENDLLIHHSVLIKKCIERIVKKDGTIQPVKFFLPQAEGIDSIINL
ncbi:MAG: NTP transferase domain-containing protein [bacterium]